MKGLRQIVASLLMSVMVLVYAVMYLISRVLGGVK